MYTRLNHLSVSFSYTGTLKVVTDVSTLHKIPVEEWLSSGDVVKFVGDNVDKKPAVRDIRSDHRSEMLHMFSMLIIRGRLPHEDLSITYRTSILPALSASSFLPTFEDVIAIKQNLVVLVSRILTTYVKCLAPLQGSLCTHYTQALQRNGKKV